MARKDAKTLRVRRARQFCGAGGQVTQINQENSRNSAGQAQIRRQSD